MKDKIIIWILAILLAMAISFPYLTGFHITNKIVDYFSNVTIERSYTYD